MKRKLGGWTSALIALAVLTLGTCVGGPVGGYLYLRWANTLPEFDPPAVELPSPNAFDEFLVVSESLEIPAAAAQRQRQWEIEAGLPPGVDLNAPLPALREAVERNREALERLRAAFALPYREPPRRGWLDRSDHSALFRNAARLFAAASRVAAADGDWPAAAGNALDAIELGSRVAQGAAWLGSLFATSGANAGARELERALPRLGEREARAVLARLQALRAAWPPFAAALENESWLVRGTIHRAFAPVAEEGLLRALPVGSDVEADEVERGEAVLRLVYLWVPKRPLLAEIEEYFKRSAAEAAKPWGEQEKISPPDSGLAGWFIPGSYQAGQGRLVFTDAALAVSETWLQARLFEFQYGRPAADLDELLAFAGELPADPFAPDGGPVRYRRDGDAFLVYSVALNGQDDGGTPRDRDAGWRDPWDPAPGPPGDYVFGRLYRDEEPGG